ncbi:alpha-1,2-mannosyltransferase [Arthrobacter sp. yr096]|uniref:glycosyltransferase 87 family protein n=1 Tax=Arthrobacter sp. yr096 TaxID=1761750 RepID=UPI0008C10607|nr:glycosyltransferase 87 family protein [Arthrobacter sp. yr096]SEI44234.1 alpha-1,2-mannosyltransferase [Arthrobacter sp. yr096]
MALPDVDLRATADAAAPRKKASRSSVLLRLLPLAVLVVPVWMMLADWSKQGLDFSVYWFGGSILNQAGPAPSELYGPSVASAGGPQLPFTYPPFAALVFGLLARMPQAAALMLFNVAGVALAAWVAVTIVRYWSSKPDLRSALSSTKACWIACALFLAVVFLGPWRETLAFGQINILLMGLMVIDLLGGFSKRRGFRGSGFLVGVAAGIKLTPLVFGLYFLMRKDWRGLANMAIGFAATVLLGWLLRPAESLQFWLEILPDTSRIGGAGYVDNLSIKGALLHFGVPHDSVTLPWLALSLATIVLAALLIRAASAQGARVLAISTTALAMLLISPVSWSHHWVWMAVVLPAFAWTIKETPARYKTQRIVMGAVLAVSTAVFFFSPKTIGLALGSADLNVQTPGLWIMASSAGVFCAVAILICWFVALRRNSVRTDEVPDVPTRLRQWAAARRQAP